MFSHRLLLVVGIVPLFAGPAFGSESVPTFNKDVAPILFARCSSCHRPGEVAPFPLLTYSDAKKRVAQIVRVTRSRYMPPWKAEPTVDFIGARYLSDKQLDVIKRWAEGGASEGNAADLPQPPQFIDGWQLGPPDLVVMMPKPFTVPAEGPDLYRNFVVPIKFPAGKYLKGVEYRPGNRRVVHHAVLSTVTGTARLTDRGGGVESGLSPLGTVLPGSVGIWAPGKDPVSLPSDLSLPWPTDAQLVLQLHLHPSGKPEVEQSSIGFYFTDHPPRTRITTLTILNKAVDIEAGDGDHHITQSMILPYDLVVIGEFPHMHLLGKTVSAQATLPGGKTVPLLSIKDWDFNWQTYYQFAHPLRLPKGTRINVEWTYDNSAKNPRNPSDPPRRVTYGEQTTNEMAVMVMEVASLGESPTHAK